jgi:hypothetical protein
VFAKMDIPVHFVKLKNALMGVLEKVIVLKENASAKKDLWEMYFF